MKRETASTLRERSLTSPVLAAHFTRHSGFKVPPPLKPRRALHLTAAFSEQKKSDSV